MFLNYCLIISHLLQGAFPLLCANKASLTFVKFRCVNKQIILHVKMKRLETRQSSQRPGFIYLHARRYSINAGWHFSKTLSYIKLTSIDLSSKYLQIRCQENFLDISYIDVHLKCIRKNRMCVHFETRIYLDFLLALYSFSKNPCIDCLPQKM